MARTPRHAVLLDTHVAVWLTTGRSLKPRALRTLELARVSSDEVYASAATAWEAAMLVRKGRLTLRTDPLRWYCDLNVSGVRNVDLTPEILVAAVNMPGSLHKDPFDRMIAATAQVLKATLLTNDQALLDYAAAGWIDAVAC